VVFEKLACLRKNMIQKVRDLTDRPSMSTAASAAWPYGSGPLPPAIARLASFP
jgi:hypothetical protein